MKLKNRKLTSATIAPIPNSSNNPVGSKSSESLKDIYKEFATESSIHGIKYTVNVKSTWGKIFWVIVIILSITSASFLAKKFYEKHHEANMRTLIISKHYESFNIPFPAVTFCHSNLASMERINKFLDSEPNLQWPLGLTAEHFKKNLRYIREILYPTNKYERQLNQLQQILEYNNITITKLFHIISIPCTDYIIMCELEGEIVPCRKIIRRSLTSNGFCCSFNYAHISGKNKWRKHKNFYTYFFGPRWVFSVLIKPNPVNDKVSFTIHGTGVKVIIHDSYAYPAPSSRQFVATQGHEVFGFLKADHLTISPDLEKLSAEERKCQMSYNDNIYRAENCHVKCQQYIIKNLCDCVPFYAFIIEPNDTICDLRHVSCLAQNKQFLSTDFWTKECNCLPNCEGTYFTISPSEVPMNAPQFVHSEFYDTAFINPGSTAVHITYARQIMTLLRKELVLSWINLVSSLGGVFCLFLGCSVVSLFEIIYYVTYVIWKYTCKGKRPRNIATIEIN